MTKVIKGIYENKKKPRLFIDNKKATGCSLHLKREI